MTRHFFLHIIMITFSAVGFMANAAELTFAGYDHEPICISPESSTGLDNIYMLFDTRNATASFTAQSNSAQWLKFSSLGGGYAEEIECQRDGKVSSIKLSTDDMGYIIEDGTSRYYFWIINYANHYASLDELEISPEQECDRARLMLIGNASRINYYTINGQAKELSRALDLEYKTLVYDEDSEVFNQTDVQIAIASIDETVSAPAPLCDTHFVLSGDQFLRTWGLTQRAESPLYDAISVEAHTSAVQETREFENEQRVEGDALGGSGPIIINFSAQVSDKAIFREWQISRNPEFEPIDDRFRELDFQYTFTDNGTTYVKFVADNAAGTCQFDGETYQVFVGESALLCPNAFSPYGSEGVNDEWRVSYKSIIQFECSIFNRWGQKMCSFTNPGQGWDGRYGGKIVPPGVYYYVIKAVGSDGKKYNLNGDINILKSRTNPYGTGTDSETPIP